MAGVGGRCHSSLGTYSDRPCDMIGVIHPGLAMSEIRVFKELSFFFKVRFETCILNCI